MTLSLKKLYEKSTAELEEIYDKGLEKLPSRAAIYLPTERVGLVEKIIGVSRVHEIYKNGLDKKYRPKLRKLRERYKNSKRCFLIGNGPSLNQTDLSMLENEVTFAVNGFFLKSQDLTWKPTFYLIEDHLVAEDRAIWINDLKGPLKLFPAYLGYAFPEREDTIFYNHRPRISYPHGFDFSLEADKITYTGCTVTFSMMQIAAYLGFEEIYLVGVDASYDIPKDTQEGKDYAVGVLDMKSDDPNHFDPNYFGKGFRWHDPQVDKMVDAYRKARETLEGTGQAIYNATIGGKLEVFERRSFQDLFPAARTPEQMEKANEALKLSKYPRLLVMDMTPLGGGTATGEVKANLLNGWPQDRLLQIARHGKDQLITVKQTASGDFVETKVKREEAVKAVESFGADAVLYRPVPNTTRLHEFSMDMIGRLKKPIITWIMDDWPTALSEKDPEQWAKLEDDLKYLLDNAVLNLSICDKMSEAFGKRYNTSFKAFANGVNPVQWPALRHHQGKSLKVRYSGGLGKDMTLESVLRVAHAVEALAEEGHDISLEISTQPWWYRESGHLFEELKCTAVEVIKRTAEEYRQWLSAADVVLIAYNHDEETLRYVRYSMANKMPECLASGAALFVHGPKEVATVEYLDNTKAALVVEEKDDSLVIDGLRSLLENPSMRNELVTRAREIAFSKHNIVNLREALRSSIADAATGSAIDATASTEYTTHDTVIAVPDPDLPNLDVSNPPVDQTPSPSMGSDHWSELTLISLSGNLLLSPKITLLSIDSEPEVKDSVQKALSHLPEKNFIVVHFNSVLKWAEKQAGTQLFQDFDSPTGIE